MNHVYNESAVTTSGKSPQLVLHAESNPFGNSLDSHKNASDLFKKLTGSNIQFSQFVGFLSTGHITYICLPKVFNDCMPQQLTEGFPKQWFKIAHLLRKSLIKYKESKKKQASVALYESYIPDRHHQDRKKPVSHLALAQMILDDYLHQGLWYTNEHQYQQSESGSIDWSRTISRGGELWLNDFSTPIYTKPTTKHRQLKEDHPLTLAQIAVLYDLSILYGPIIHEGDIHLPQSSIHTQHHQSLPYLGKKLRKNLRSINQQRARRLAELLLKYIELDDYGRQDQIDIYGTTSFELIFEHMCADVFGSDPDLLTKTELGQVQWTFKPFLKDQIGTLNREGSTQRPDLLIRGEMQSKPSAEYILYLKPNRDSSTLMVLDAKYYDIIGALSASKDKDTASHLPGLKDIRKQYAYADWIKDKLGVAQKNTMGINKVENGLVFPFVAAEKESQNRVNKDRIYLTELGAVQLGDKQAIQVLGIDLVSLMQWYLTSTFMEANAI